MAISLGLACGGGHAGRTGGPRPEKPSLADLPEGETHYVSDPESGARFRLLRAGFERGGTPLVLVHGLGDAGMGDFRPVLASLRRTRPVLAFDLPGFGGSSTGRPPYSPERFSELLSRVIDRYAGGHADVMGHSMGGAVALMHAGRFAHQVRRLILLDVAGVLHEEALVGTHLKLAGQPGAAESGQTPPAVRRLMEVAEGTADTVLRGLRAVTPGTGSIAALAERGDAPVGARAALALATTDFGPAIDTVRAPTLIVWGRRDTIAPVRTAWLLRDRIADAHLVFLEEVGHVPMTEAPERLLALVEAHLGGETLEPSIGMPALASTEGAGQDLRCSGEADRVLRGRFGTITLDGCARASLLDVQARHLILRDSSVRIVSSHLEGLTTTESRVEMTGGSLAAPDERAAIEASGSLLDLAGVVIGAARPIEVRSHSRLLLSVCVLRDSQHTRHLHGVRDLQPGATL
ncbi:MAG: alpha/beta fold hydrolase [Myxococcales bacterium]|nr:alpha/beta fold hydrolase [Myxococcales bacterium]